MYRLDSLHGNYHTFSKLDVVGDGWTSAKEILIAVRIVDATNCRPKFSFGRDVGLSVGRKHEGTT